MFQSFQRLGVLRVSDVRRSLGVDRQTARRDLQALIDAGVPLEESGRGAERRFTLPRAHRRNGLTVSPGDALALHFGRQLLSFAEGTELTGSLDQLSTKLETAKPRAIADMERCFDQRLLFLSEPYRPYGTNDDAVDDVLTALLHGTRLDLTYAAPHARVSHWERIEPLALVIYRRALYLLARFAHSDTVLRLAVDRIQDATNTRVPFRYPADFDAREELDRHFGIHADRREPERVRIRFSPRVAHLVSSRVWHPTAEVTLADDGAAILELVASGQELVRMVLEWGPTAQVLEPAWLRAEVKKELTEALAHYG